MAQHSTPSFEAQDVFHVAGSVRQYQQQMHGFSALAADAMKLMLRQSQLQMEYLNALSRCHDLPSVGAVTTEFAQKLGEEMSAEWQQAAHLAERWMATATQPEPGGTDADAAHRHKSGSAH